MEREAEGRKKTGVFTGFYAVNNLNGRLMPIWISDFVLASFGTGAVVGVPGHDIRDFEFAKEFNLDIIRVVVGKDGDRSPIRKKEQVQEEEGTMINSEFLDGINIHDATKKIMDYIEEKGWGKRVITYHLRDWIFSRQHYWGEPIPMIFCPKCAENQCQSSNVKCQNDNTMSGWFPIPEDQLPLKLPYVKSYKPTNTGESPLAHIKEFVETKCPKCEGKARRETDTMPNWAGSNWYFIRYLDNKNDKEIAGREKMNCWMPVDIYQGGFEHTTLHLLYSRFIYKFIYDIDVVPSNEPYAKRRSHGIVLGPDGRKMSKSFNNVINPDDISKDYGADTLRIYEMFIGPFDQMVAWSDKTVAGVYRFLKRVWNVYQQLSQKSKARLPSPMAQAISEQVKSQKYPPAIAYGSGNWRAGNSKLKTEENKELVAKLKKTILKVTSDFDNLKFNTAVAAMMEFVNAFEESVQVQSSKFKVQSLSTENAKRFLQILAPFAPFITEEIWHSVFGEKKSIHLSKWPDVNKEPIDEEEIIIPVQVNGKLRSTISIKYQELSIKNRVEKLAIKDEKVKKYLEGKKYQVIYIPNKILNFVKK